MIRDKNKHIFHAQNRKKKKAEKGNAGAVDERKRECNNIRSKQQR